MRKRKKNQQHEGVLSSLEVKQFDKKKKLVIDKIKQDISDYDELNIDVDNDYIELDDSEHIQYDDAFDILKNPFKFHSIEKSNNSPNNTFTLNVTGHCDSIDHDGNFFFNIDSSTNETIPFDKIIIKKIDSLPSYNPFLTYNLIVTRYENTSVWGVYRIISVVPRYNDRLTVRDLILHLVKIRHIDYKNEGLPYAKSVKDTSRGVIYVNDKSSTDREVDIDDDEKEKMMDDLKSIGCQIINKTISKDSINHYKITSTNDIISRSQLYYENLLYNFRPLKLDDRVCDASEFETICIDANIEFSIMIKHILLTLSQSSTFYRLLRYFHSNFLLKIVERSSTKENAEKKLTQLDELIKKNPYVFCFWDSFKEIICTKSKDNYFNVHDEDNWLLLYSDYFMYLSFIMCDVPLYEFYKKNDTIYNTLPYWINESEIHTTMDIRSMIKYTSTHMIWSINTLRNAIIDNYDEYFVVDSSINEWNPDLMKLIYISLSIYLKHTEKRFYDGSSTCMEILTVPQLIPFYQYDVINFLISNDLMKWHDTLSLIMEKKAKVNQEIKDVYNKMIEMDYMSPKIGITLDLNSEIDIVDRLTNKKIIKHINFIDCDFVDDIYANNIVVYSSKIAPIENTLFIAFNRIMSSYLNHQTKLTWKTLSELKQFDEYSHITHIVIDTVHKYSAHEFNMLLDHVIVHGINATDRHVNTPIGLILFGDPYEMLNVHHDMSGGNVYNDLRRLPKQFATVERILRKNHPLYNLRMALIKCLGITDVAEIGASLKYGQNIKDIKDHIIDINNKLPLAYTNIIDEYYEIDKKIESVNKHYKPPIVRKKKYNKSNANPIEAKPAPTKRRKKSNKMLTPAVKYIDKDINLNDVQRIHYFTNSIDNYNASKAIHIRKGLIDVSKKKYDYMLRGFSPYNFYVGNTVYVKDERCFGVIERANIYYDPIANKLEKTSIAKRDDIQLSFKKYEVQISGKVYSDSTKLNLIHSDFKAIQLYCGMPSNTVIYIIDASTSIYHIINAIKYCKTDEFYIYVLESLNFYSVIAKNNTVNVSDTTIPMLISSKNF
jgi:hypothetical protein